MSISRIEQGYILKSFSPPYSKDEIKFILNQYSRYNPDNENYTGSSSWSLHSKLNGNAVLRYDLLFKDDVLVGGVGLQLYRTNILLVTRLFSNSRQHGGKYVPALAFREFINFQMVQNFRFLIFTFNLNARLDKSIELKRSRVVRDKTYLLWQETLDKFVKISRPCIVNHVLQNIYVHDLLCRPEEIVSLLE